MKTGICYLVGAGVHYFNDVITPDSDDFVIAVDGGYDYLINNGIQPDLLVGDFDSAQSTLNTSKVGCKVLDFPPEKDYTDMYLAALEGHKLGYRIFYIYGGTGNRIDHTFSNINLLAHLSTLDSAGYLFDEHHVITAITDSELILSINSTDKYHAGLKAKKNGYITVLSHSDISECVNLRGLKYPTYDVTMTNSTVLGTSNEFTGRDCSISVKKGTLLIVLERQQQHFQ